MNKYRFLNSTGEHLHQLNIDGEWKPLLGTSTVLKVLALPLTWWASGLAVTELGWSPIRDRNRKFIPIDQRLPIASQRLAEIKEMSDAEYLALLDKAYAAHASTLKKSAVKGTDMHTELESYVHYCLVQNQGEPIETESEFLPVKIFAEWSLKNVPRFVASEAHCFSEELWTGGIVDLVYENENGSLVVLDFKSSKDAYYSQFLQDAGYDIAISENGVLDANGNLICRLDKPITRYGVFPFGMTNPEPQFHYDIEGAKNGFRAAVTLHKLIGNQ